MDDDDSVGISLGAVLGTTEGLILGFWLGMEEDDPVETSVWVVLGTTSNMAW